MIVLDEFEPATWSVSISRTAWWGSESLLVGVVSVSINVTNFGTGGVAREEDLAACPALDGIESLAVVLAMDQREDLVVALLAEVVPDLGLGSESLPRVYDMLAVTRLQSDTPSTGMLGKLSSIDIPAIWQRVCGVDSGCDRTERPWGR